MKQQALLEFFTPEQRIIEEVIDEKTGERALRVEVKWQHLDKINANGRLYRRGLMERELGKIADSMKGGKVFGASYHPPADAEVDDVSHIWESYEVQKDGACTGVIKVIPTARGKNAIVILKNGGVLGMSSRGAGTLVPKKMQVDGKEVAYEEVGDDYRLKSPGDFVLSPSVIDAGTVRIMEKRWNEADNSKPISEDAMEFKNVDELRANFPELFKPLDEEKKTLQDKVVTLETEINELNERGMGLQEAYDAMVETVRVVVEGLCDVPGVLPEEDGEPEDGEPEAKVEPEVKPEDESLKKENETLKAEKLALEAKIKASEDATAAKVKTEAIVAETEKLIEAEPEDRRKLIRAEVIIEGKPIAESVEAVKAKVEEAKAKVATTIAEINKQKIVGGGIGEKGRVTNPEGGLTEAEIKARWSQARDAGYKGDLNEYKKAVLNIK